MHLQSSESISSDINSKVHAQDRQRVMQPRLKMPGQVTVSRNAEMKDRKGRLASKQRHRNAHESLHEVDVPETQK